MHLQTLVENTSHIAGLQGEHGLSFYIETGCHKILFDTGASALFSKNAATMGIDLSSIDLAVLSHGHYDHGGGLATFLKLNQAAPIYIQEEAFGAHYSKTPAGFSFIGLDSSLRGSSRFIPVHDHLRIDEKLELFSYVQGPHSRPDSNQNLYILKESTYDSDPFIHEQNLALTEGNCRVLLAGCAHCGILNILEEYKHLFGGCPDYVIGGLHLTSPRTGKCASSSTIQKLAKTLKETPTAYYTCHCTGPEAYQILKEQMGEQIQYLSTGMSLSLPHL